MMVTIEQAQTKLGELVERSARGERIVITREQTPVVELRAVAADGPAPRFGAAKGMLNIVSEDDEHLHDFAKYMK